MRKLLFILILIQAIAFAQEEKKEDIWAPFRYFVGEWEGTGKGQSGTSKLQAEAKLILNDRYLELSGRMVFVPQDRNKKEEVYEDLSFLSYDKMRQKYVLRQFSAPGFVTQYALENLPADGKTFVFVSETMENMPPGWKARATYHILNKDEFHQTFELAAPGKDFGVVSESDVRRKR